MKELGQEWLDEMNRNIQEGVRRQAVLVKLYSWTIRMMDAQSSFGSMQPFGVHNKTQARLANMRDYGLRLRAARGVSREDPTKTLFDMSGFLGVSIEYVSGVEQARMPPFSDETTKKIVEFLGLPNQVYLNLSVARQHAEEAFEQLGGLVEIDALI